MISFVCASIVLGLDVDLLINGPSYFLSKLVIRVSLSGKQVNEDDVEGLTNELVEARQSLWVYVPMMVVLVVATIVLFMSLVGCVGAATLSYAMLSGFSMFMFVTSMLAAAAIIWIFCGNMEDSIVDKFAMEKIEKYHKKENYFNFIIDYIQTDMECCGFKSPNDWRGSLPPSCCNSLLCLNNTFPTNYTLHTSSDTEVILLSEALNHDEVSKNNTDDICSQTCIVTDAHPKSCLGAMRDQAFTPNKLVGAAGISMVTVVSFMILNFILSFWLCSLVRKNRLGRSFEASGDLELTMRGLRGPNQSTDVIRSPLLKS